MRLPVIAAILSLPPLLLSCARDHLWYADTDTAPVLVEADWTPAGVTPNGMTVYAYGTDGTLYRRFPPVPHGSPCVIRLPEGEYVLLAMNDTPGEFSGRVDFTGEERMDTFLARGVTDTRRALPDNPERLIVEPDTLALAISAPLTVRPDQVEYHYSRPSGSSSPEQTVRVALHPQSAVVRMEIRAHVKGLRYARGTTLSFLSGLPGSCSMRGGPGDGERVRQSFILNSRVFDEGSDSDGTIRASFLAFDPGEAPQEPLVLEVGFVLVSGEPYPVSVDVTDVLTRSGAGIPTVTAELEITLPEAVGNEKDDFATDINDWYDESVDIPI